MQVDGATVRANVSSSCATMVGEKERKPRHHAPLVRYNTDVVASSCGPLTSCCLLRLVDFFHVNYSSIHRRSVPCRVIADGIAWWLAPRRRSRPWWWRPMPRPPPSAMCPTDQLDAKMIARGRAEGCTWSSSSTASDRIQAVPVLVGGKHVAWRGGACMGQDRADQALGRPRHNAGLNSRRATVRRPTPSQPATRRRRRHATSQAPGSGFRPGCARRAAAPTSSFWPMCSTS